MRRISRIWLPLVVAAFVAGCTADVEDEGSLPDVDVSGGEMPNVDVEPADVEITTDTQTVVTPDVDIEAREP
ncbi:MAG: hypothetical protein WD766_04420 [Gemmatimonadota bacterium]